MKRILITVILILATWPAEAHCFTRWHYPWIQRGCGQRHALTRALPILPKPLSNQERIANVKWPTLEVIDWGSSGDERWRGLALLRALSDGR